MNKLCPGICCEWMLELPVSKELACENWLHISARSDIIPVEKEKAGKSLGKRFHSRLLERKGVTRHWKRKRAN